ncbi:hypothetical protein BKA62DRAFT_769724 [Auriculariales sp. MPI-PUGE-AT-0066]|nr:hypothetical protein BKA62DRAFT_769724 [Auriculariales sp. MPI-PUGE-AT-0066]
MQGRASGAAGSVIEQRGHWVTLRILYLVYSWLFYLVAVGKISGSAGLSWAGAVYGGGRCFRTNTLLNIHRLLELKADVVVVYWAAATRTSTGSTPPSTTSYSIWHVRYLAAHAREEQLELARVLLAQSPDAQGNERKIVRDRGPITTEYDDVHFMATFLGSGLSKPD